ncbi:MAG: hypothetical protein R6U89_00745 [Dehalococcoidia bacterium]
MFDKLTKTNIKRNRLGLCVSVALAVTVLLVVAVPGFTSAMSEKEGNDTDTLPPCMVPVILDGVYYEPAEFNRIHNELHAKGIYLGYCFDEEGTLLAFTTREGIDKWHEERGLRTITEICEAAEKAGPTKIIPVEPGSRDSVVSNWENINYGGNGFTVADNGTIDNLHSSGWGDEISSVLKADTYCEILWEDINQSGDHFSIRWWKYDEPNLGWYGWNDRASSLETG